jgi:hypothetical protein
MIEVFVVILSHLLIMTLYLRVFNIDKKLKLIEFINTLNIKILVFWNMTQSSLVDVH